MKQSLCKKQTNEETVSLRASVVIKYSVSLVCMQYSVFETAERDKEEYYIEKFEIKEYIKIA